MKHSAKKTGAFFMLSAAFACTMILQSCSPKKDVAAKTTAPVQYRLKVVDQDGNYTYSTPVTVNE